MNFKALLTIFIFVAGLLFVAVGDADAARFGGGKSFGSKPSMQQKAPAPASPMMQQKAPAAGAAGAAGAAAKPGFSMGGMMGGLLAGTLLGSLLFGGAGGMGGGGMGGFMDILIIGLLIFVGIKLYSRFKASRSAQTATAGGPAFGRMQAPEQEPMARQDNNSGMSWGNLQNQSASASAAAPSPAVPEGFDSEDFLRGAKMAYTRLQAAWDKRDAADIANFARPAVLEEVQKQIEAEPTPSKTELLLVNAQLLEVKNEGTEQNAMVFFDVLLREDPAQTTPTQVREIWHFTRPLSGEDSWKLEGIQQVE